MDFCSLAEYKESQTVHAEPPHIPGKISPKANSIIKTVTHLRDFNNIAPLHQVADLIEPDPNDFGQEMAAFFADRQSQ